MMSQARRAPSTRSKEGLSLAHVHAKIVLQISDKDRGMVRD